MPSVTFSIDDLGVGHITIDVPDAKVNTLSSEVLDELEAAITQAKEHTEVKVIRVESGKERSFIAGADIEEFTRIQSRAEARKLSQRGQAVFNALSHLPQPTVAVIDGVCLGGGLELALACSCRVAVDEGTSLGAPEVRLGVVPGWGGTQRLPRLIGLVAALGMIVGGKPINARRALKMKLVDKVVARAFLEETLREFLEAILTDEGRGQILSRRKRKGFKTALLEKNPVGCSLVCHQAKKKVLRQTKGQYPAPLKVIDLLKETFGCDLDFGLKKEAETIAKLFESPVTKNLIRLFFVDKKVKKDPGVRTEAAAKEIKRTAVLGAGVMGGGIAWLFSSGDRDVRLKDINWDAVTVGFKQANENYKALVRLHKLTDNQVSLKMHKITGTVDYRGLAQADLIAEAIVEDLEIKKKVFSELEEHIRDDAIVCSNTSALSITEMGKAFTAPERFVGMHFFNPVNRMPLVEVIPGEKTASETVATVVALLQELKKTPIVVSDCPGFLVNRILMPYLSEAGWLLQESVDFEKVDRLMEKFGMPMGPYKLLDTIGLDIAFHVARTLEAAYGDRMRVPPVFETLVDAGFVGKKAKKGFYIRKGRGNPALKRLLSQQGFPKPRVSQRDTVDRMVLRMVKESQLCLEEKVVPSADHLDMAMIMGTGFPPWRGGVIAYAEERGEKEIEERLRELQERYGSRF